MAGSDPRNNGRRPNGRIVPSIAQGSSRVSRAAGSVGSQSIQSARVEQRSNSGGRQSSGRGASSSRQQGQRGKSTQSSNSSSRRGASSTRPGSTRPGNAAGRNSSSSSSPSNASKDVQLLKWIADQWNSLEPHHQKQVWGVVFLFLSLLTFGALTIFQQSSLLGWLNSFLLAFLGWSAYPFVLGLVALALIRLIESIRIQQILRWSMILGLICIWLLILIESRLIIGKPVGILAELLVGPLLGWPAVAQHILVLGLLILSVIVTFRITFGHILMIFELVSRLIGEPPEEAEEKPAAPQQRGRSVSGSQRGDFDNDGQEQLFLGKRPRYSRYSHGTETVEVDEELEEMAGRRTWRARRPIQDDDIVDPEQEPDLEDAATQFFADEDQDEDEDQIEYDSEYEADEYYDPLNDINLHQQEVGSVPRGPRAPRAIDLDEHVAAVRGVKQESLPFDRRAAGPDKLVIQPQDMEPLAPNPRLASGKKSRTRQKVVQEQVDSIALPQISSAWKLPGTDILNRPDEVKLQLMGDDTSGLAHTIQETLRSFRVDAEVREEDISVGPTIIRFGIRPTGKPEMRLDERSGKMVPVRDSAGNLVYETRTRVSRIMALQNDLALVLEAKTIRMEAPVPGRPYIGVEIPNKNSRLVTLREVLESKEYLAAKAKSKLAIGLGKDVAGLVRVGDLARMPHLLIAGATGAGKSVCINTIIASILTQATPDDVQLLMVDPKMVELNMYNGIPHLNLPVVTEVDKVVSLLKNAINEMERRYRLFSQLGVRNLDGYRKMRLEKIAHGDTSLNNLPSIVIIIDELADLMMAAPEEVEGMICRLAQLARAIGIHLVVATQRPSVDVITGLIKANIPTRISFMVSSQVDSRTIIDMGGAERLLGRGDMLYLPADAGRPERIQGAFLADEEAQALVEYWKEQKIAHAEALAGVGTNVEDVIPSIKPGWEVRDEPADEFELDDDLLDRAEEIVRVEGRASASLLQRKLRIGYSRAARLIDLLEEHGIIGRSEGGGRAREVFDQNDDPGARTMVDEVEDIMEQEKARDEFLRRQQQADPGRSAIPPRRSARRYVDEENE
jgi:DNA segregation ATPase FtsK/SpoIIIE-like protein